MTKSKQVPRLNQVLAMLVKTKPSQISVATSLGISSQSLGYYMRGRKIPAEVVQRWSEVYGQNLIELSKMDFDVNLDTIVLNGTRKPVDADGKTSFDRAVEREAISAELWRQLQKDHAMFEKELDRAWALIDRLLPQSNAKPVKRINSDE